MKQRRIGQLLTAGLIIAGIAVTGTAVTGCGGHASHPPEPPAAAVRAVAVESTEEPQWIEAVGSIRSVREATVASKVMGTVVQIRKQAGETVRKGEVLIIVDSRDVEGQIGSAKGALAQARAAASIAETNLRRFEQLFEKKAASPLELDQARYQYETAMGAVAQAEGAVETASSFRSYAEIPAPFDGRVVDRLCEVGDMAAPGRPLMKVEDGARLRIDVSLPETAHGAVRAGDSVRVQIPSLGEQGFTGKVTEVVPAADPMTRSFLVKVELPENPALRSGLYGQAMIPSGAKRAIRIPAGSVLARGGLTGVFVAEGDRAGFRLVTARPLHDERVEILSGLSDGDRLVLDPPADLRVGQPLEVRP